MLKVLSVTLIAMAVLAAACGGGGGAKAQVYGIQVDGKAVGFTAAFTSYFPHDVSAHPGDEIDFTSVFSGEPHTVTLGKDVNDVFALIAKACPNGGLADPACQQGPPQQYADQYNQLDKKLPHLLPEGPGDANQAAAQPCFLATGDAPAEAACSAAQQQQPDFDGTQTYYNSGFLEDQAVFKVKLSKDIQPGTYNFYCLLHREGMSGMITIVDKNTKVPTPAEVKKAGEDHLSELTSKLKPAFDKLAPLTADTAQAGAILEAVPDAEVTEFGPKEISIPTGGSVTWTIFGAHSISFNAPTDASPVLIKGSDGGWHVNQKGAPPAKSPGQPEANPNAPPPAANAPPTQIDAGQWDGKDFHSSGIILSFPPRLFAYKLTFTKAGTYTYVCLIHPDMKGTVKVGG